MTKKKRKHPSVEEVLSRPWCYYCERDFDDLKILINHQKAKHFKCDRCHRRLNTAGGLAVHMSQVHKDQLTQVENALPNRQGLDVEIFGMEGIPEQVQTDHHQRVIQQYYEQQADRAKNTGNPAPGSGQEVVRKKPRTETSDELMTRLEKWIKDRRAGLIDGGVDPMTGIQPTSQLYSQQQQPPGMGFGPPGIPQGYPGYPTLPNDPRRPPPPALSGPPGAALNNTGLPQRPTADLSASVDDLISNEAAAAPEKSAKKEDSKGKKEKKEIPSRLVFGDTENSIEERMAMLPKYAFDRPRFRDEPTVLASVTGESGAGVTGPATEDIVDTQ